MVNVTLFSQILQHINRNFFTKVVEKYSTDKHNKGINSWTHLVTMLFCQFAKCQSIRANKWATINIRKSEPFRDTKKIT